MAFSKLIEHVRLCPKCVTFAGSQLCLAHFVNRKSDDPDSPDFVPSIFPTAHVPPKSQADEDRLSRRKGRNAAVQGQGHANAGVLFDLDEDMPQVDMSEVDLEEAIEMAPICLEYGTQTLKCTENWPFKWECITVSQTDKHCQVSIPPSMSGQTKATTVATQTRQMQDLEPSASDVARQAALPFLDFRDKQFLAFTGVSKSLFQFLSHRVGGKLDDSRSLTRELKIVLVLVKLKSNMTFVNLACMFEVSHFHVKDIFIQAMNSLYEAVKFFVIWFNRHKMSLLPLAWHCQWCNPILCSILACLSIRL
jgi:hypothetical protein